MCILHTAHGHAKRHYEKHYKARYQERAHLVFLLDAILVSIAIALLGVGFYFRWFYHPLRDDFKLSLLSEQTITAGKETTFTVRIVNGGTTELHDATLTVHLPDTFVSAQMPEGYDPKTGEIKVGEMSAHASYAYNFHGVLIGTSHAADVYVHFIAQNNAGHADETLTKGTLRWEKDAIETRFETPESVVPGQSIVFALHVKNGSDLAFENANVVPTWEESFKLQNATPPLYRGKIALGRLEAGEEVVVNFSGRFTGLLDPSVFRARLDGTLNGTTMPLAEASASVRMANLGLRLWTIFPDDLPAFVRPGQDVPIRVGYQNDGERTIKNLALEIAPDVNTLGEVRWETSNRIASLAPGEHGERKAFVRVRDSVSRYVTNPVFRVIPQATLSIDEPKIIDAQISGTAVEAKISGSARLRAVARYYTSESDQLGRGPLPPRVGKTTTYWIFASLETGATELQDGFASFRLPAGVTWTGRAAVTVGQDLVLEGDRLIWRIGVTDPHAGVLHEAPSASFEVALTPTGAQVGTTPLLLSDAAYTGTDAWTDEALTSSQGGLSTQLPGDTVVAGRGQVKPLIAEISLKTGLPRPVFRLRTHLDKIVSFW